MERTANEIIKEIQFKIAYYRQVLKDDPYLMKNLVIIIPNDDYEILAKEAAIYYMSNNVLAAKFDSFMGYDLKISADIDKIYIALNLIYKSEKKMIGDKENDK